MIKHEVYDLRAVGNIYKIGSNLINLVNLRSSIWLDDVCLNYDYSGIVMIWSIFSVLMWLVESLHVFSTEKVFYMKIQLFKCLIKVWIIIS